MVTGDPADDEDVGDDVSIRFREREVRRGEKPFLLEQMLRRLRRAGRLSGLGKKEFIPEQRR